MKVLITVPRLSLQGGVVAYFQSLAPHLGSEVTYFECGAKDEKRTLTATVTRLLADLWRFWRTLTGGRYDLVQINPSLLAYACLRDGCFLLLARARRIPVVVMFHGWDKSFADILERRCLWLFRLVYGQATAFIVLALEFKSKLESWRLPQRVLVETTAIDEALLECTSTPRSPNDGRPGTLNILFLARLERSKGIYTALDAFAIARKSLPTARLIVAGDGPEKTNVAEYIHAKGLDDVTLVGFVTGLAKAAVFEDAHIYLFPTAYAEGLPTSVLEAMAFGLPVITRPVGGLVDFFAHGTMGYLEPSLEPAVFAQHLVRLAGDKGLRESIGNTNQFYARDRFLASKVAERLKLIYASLVHGPA